MQVRIVSGIDLVGADEWNQLDLAGQPFLRHEFLAALEQTGCAAPATGWQPAHVLARDAAGRLVGAMPLYRKSNSWGEFVFDFAWADAYRRAGLRYFPKLVSAVPFTPATGPRLLVAPDTDRAAVSQAVLQCGLEEARSAGASSLHVLFPDAESAHALREQGLLMRKDCQFHWHNKGYEDFDAFLGEFTAEKRKKARRERRRVSEAGISFSILGGAELDDARWATLMPLYGSSFWRRGREPYLNEAFFRNLSRTMPESLVVIVAQHQDEPVAVAICLRSADTLYGRYWGTAGDFHSLHFETCYYQGIEYCIRHGLQRFEPGTQGEHKISRGFVPTETWSAHWLSDPRFATAIDQYLDRERDYMDQYIVEARAHVPYREL